MLNRLITIMRQTANTLPARFHLLSTLLIICCAQAMLSTTALCEDEISAAETLPGQYVFTQTSNSFLLSLGDYENFDFDGYTMYKVYLNTVNSDDFVRRIYGDENLPLEIMAPSGVYNNNVCVGGTSGGVPPPDFWQFTGYNVHQYDSWVGIGLTEWPVGLNNEADVVIDQTLTYTWSDHFILDYMSSGNYGALDIQLNDPDSEGGWGLEDLEATNGFAGDDNQLIVLQATTDGTFTWTLNAEIWVHGDSTNKVILTQSFDGTSLGAPIIEGCTDPNACNYYDLATTDNGTCDYPPLYYDCAGDCVNDVDSDGVCDELEIAGCQDASACNYNSAATDDDGSCAFATGCETCSGATDGTGTIVDNDSDDDGVCDADEVIGCQDVTACNYDAAATDAGACIFVDGICESCSGETDGTGTVVDNDSDDDGVCDADEVVGCQDNTACNYMSSATDAGACIYATGCESCSGESDGTGTIIDNDADDDGICDADEVAGCQDATACNFDALATDEDGSCEYCSCGQLTGLSPYSLTVEEHAVDGIPGHTTYRVYVNMEHPNDFLSAIYGEGTDTPIALTSTSTPNWYNDPLLSVDLGTDILPLMVEAFPDLAYDSWMTFGSDTANADLNIGSIDASNTFWSSFNAGSDIYIDDASGFTLYNTRDCDLPPSPDAGSCDPDHPAIGGTDGRVLIAQLTSEGVVSGELAVQILQNGQYGAGVFHTEHFEFNGPGTFSATGWNGAMASNYQDCGCTDTEALNYDDEALYDDGGCIPVILGCLNSSACNYDDSATVDDGGCVLPVDCETCSGETDGSGTVVDNDADDDGVCDADEVVGCQDNTACNYDAAATDAGSCTYPQGCETCSGETDGTGIIVDNDSDDDGVCDADEIAGCQDATACNYNSSATDADTCVYPSGCETCSGETDGSGTVVDNDADDDGVCDADEVVGCQDNTACNFNSSATDAGSCEYPTGCETCSGETDGTGSVVDNDADDDGVCDADEVVGCQDNTACNFNASATDSGACVYPVDACDTCSGETDGTGSVVDNDADDDGVCDADEIAGCQDSLACNYNSSATDAASCEYAIGCDTCSGETDGTGTVVDNDSDDDGVCDADEIAGCQDATACNYNSSATDADTCVYPSGCETCSGETDGSGTVVDNDADDDGVCDADEVVGCQDNTACNYNSSATDAGSCEYPTGCDTCSGATDGTGTVVDNDADDDGVCDADEVVGCTNSEACNYDPTATDEGTCFIAGPYYDCSGNCLNDADENGICDEIDALMNSSESTGYDNGYNTGLSECVGNDFCGEGTVWSEDFQMCVEDSSCPGDLNGDLVVGTGDLLLLLMDYGFECE